MNLATRQLPIPPKAGDPSSPARVLYKSQQARELRSQLWDLAGGFAMPETQIFESHASIAVGNSPYHRNQDYASATLVEGRFPLRWLTTVALI